MKFRWTSVAWSIAYLLLLLSLSTPLLLITTLFMIIPAIVLYTTLSTKQFILHLVPVLLIVGLITPFYIVIAAYFLIPALVMGHRYKKRASAMSTLTAGMVAVLAEFLLILLVSTAFLKFNLYDYVYDVLQTYTDWLASMGASNPLLSEITISSDQIGQMSWLTIQAIPMTLILSAFIIAVITHSIVRPILNSMGYAVPKLKPAREWRLGRAFIWYYLIGALITMLFGGADSGFMLMVSANLLPLLQIAFKIQTIGFLFFLVYERKWNKIVALLLSIPVIALPGFWIIGVVDLAFPLRELVKKSKR
ncbi:DUF2232 domain-containing protein [Paenibacillus piscarius]|uniref:DUF2232 domain-containing protein n=1 Tax=Paenibacillus piscarius TaxID=1089681 RepID=UPI001EE8A01B|nr:DUF2232 domain-containing protein [Paenibacillus piscarius]